MWTLESSWLAWMDHLENLAGAEVCEGPDYCRGYGDITIRQGLARAAQDTNFEMNWVPWVFKHTSEKALRIGMIKLIATTRDDYAIARCKHLFRDNIDAQEEVEIKNVLFRD